MNPMDWENGPPKSEAESWAWNRRCEIGGLAGRLFVRRYEEGSSEPGWDPVAEATCAVEASIEFHRALDSRMPRP